MGSRFSQGRGAAAGRMTVYIEFAFLENFLLDGLLLYLAIKCARAKVSPLRLVLAAAAGGGEAIVFPLLSLPLPLAYLVKFLGGAVLALVAAKGGFKTSLFVACAFFALTFVLGGMLVAVYSFFGVSYAEGEGYLVEGAPVALVFAGGGILLIAVTRLAAAFYRHRRWKRELLPCSMTVGERTVRWTGLADSGNRLSFRGKPVCVVSALGALALFRGSPPVGRLRISTVSGSRVSPVFVCDRLELGGIVNERVYFTVGEVDSREYSIILHTSLEEKP